MLNKLRGPLAPLIKAVATPFKFIPPDVLTLLSFIVSIPGFYFFYKGDGVLGSLFIIGALFDMIDGAVAKMRNEVSAWGGILDATMDRIYEGILVLAIGIGGLVSWPVLVVFYTASITVSYIKAKAEATVGEKTVGTNRFSIGIGSRGERIALIFIGSLLSNNMIKDYNLLTIAFLIATVASVGTVILRAWVIKKEVSKV